MENEALVELALEAQSCSQKELAMRLGVSPTQVSKWKKGDHMSTEMNERLRKLARIGDKDPSFVRSAGSLEDALKWEKLLHYLANHAQLSAETGYDTEPLDDPMGLLGWQTFQVLKEMGVAIPPRFPGDLDFDYEIAVTNDDDGDDDESWTNQIDENWSRFEANPYSSLIHDIYTSLTNVWGFYSAYVSELMFDDELDLMNTPAENIPACLIDLAATKVEVDPRFAPKAHEFALRTKNAFEGWLNIVKDKAFRAGVPLRAELLTMIHSSGEDLRDDAERESFGLNSSRLHPDVYMNELLCGMRAIHQVLPAIMKKLGIEEEFELDTSEFSIK
ncbi:helix-turn-helix domain-containing protein [Rhizobium etli]|nr:helix-turn-helix transcriptional regulator [Rhizobium etli]